MDAPNKPSVFSENSAQVLQPYIRFLYGRDCARTMMKSAK
uniref:Uncharacterized protein n=1 Tax=Yersinia enterocolitica W22703 TaxID=913028 RepID=F4MVR7_YEREN|nr:unknown protein [Yersinia enterocolitica W22703]